MNNKSDVMSKPHSGTQPATGAPPPAPGVGTAPKGAWDVVIDVYLTKGCPDPEFNLMSTLPRDPAGNIIFENNRRPGFNIRFNLHDETGSNPPYVFPAPPLDAAEACWSEVGTTCPTTCPANQVFTRLRVTNQGTALDAYNDNPGPAPGLGEFRYTLRVTNDGGATYCNLDPGGVDNNGARN